MLLLLTVSVAGACATTEHRREGLSSAVDAYNRYIRWERSERAEVYVQREKLQEFRNWADETAEKFDFQDWRIRKIEFAGPATATVEIERTGFEIPKYIQETERIHQRWVYVHTDHDDGWKITDGF